MSPTRCVETQTSQIVSEKEHKQLLHRAIEKGNAKHGKVNAFDNVTQSGEDVFPSSRHESFPAARLANRRDQSGRFTSLKSSKSAVSKRFIVS